MTAVPSLGDHAEVVIDGRGYQPRGNLSLRHREGEIDALEDRETGALLWRPSWSTMRRLARPAPRRPATYRMVGDPTEGALVVAAAKAGLWRSILKSAIRVWPRRRSMPIANG